MTLTARQMSPSDGIRTLTIQRPESTLIETLTLGNGVAYSTDVPVTVAPDSKSSNPSSSHVGAILSGVAAIFAAPTLIVQEAQAVKADQKAQAVAAQTARITLAAHPVMVVLDLLLATWLKGNGNNRHSPCRGCLTQLQGDGLSLPLG
ncbi:hypothetical protein F4801DRAFT_576039 [Xylaria longipes]|nr:hypothetical protein F4801DRAFT_576039 [Xylaria longipes]